MTGRVVTLDVQVGAVTLPMHVEATGWGGARLTIGGCPFVVDHSNVVRLVNGLLLAEAPTADEQAARELVTETLGLDL